MDFGLIGYLLIYRHPAFITNIPQTTITVPTRSCTIHPRPLYPYSVEASIFLAFALFAVKPLLDRFFLLFIFFILRAKFRYKIISYVTVFKNTCTNEVMSSEENTQSFERYGKNGVD